MDYKESKLQMGLSWVLGVIMTTLFWVTGVVLGGVVFGIVPATVTAFDLIARMRVDLQRAQMRMFCDWWQAYRVHFKQYWRESFIVSLIVFILAVNYLFLNLQTSYLTYVAFYLTILFFVVGFFVFMWFCFLSARYPEKTLHERVRNAIAYPLAFMLEMIIITVFSIAAILAIWAVTPGLVIFTGVGIWLFMWQWVFGKIHDTNGRYRLKQYWYRPE